MARWIIYDREKTIAEMYSREVLRATKRLAQSMEDRVFASANIDPPVRILNTTQIFRQDIDISETR